MSVLGRGGETTAGRRSVGAAESPHAGFVTFAVFASRADAPFGKTVRLRVETSWFCCGGGLVIRALICDWAAAVGTAIKRKRKAREVFFIATPNSRLTACSC